MREEKRRAVLLPDTRTAGRAAVVLTGMALYVLLSAYRTPTSAGAAGAGSGQPGRACASLEGITARAAVPRRSTARACVVADTCGPAGTMRRCDGHSKTYSPSSEGVRDRGAAAGAGERPQA